MNEIKIYLKTSGSIAELYKDFSLYQGSYQNVLLSLYVPKSLLYANEQNTFVNAIKTGGILTGPNGKKITTESYYADYVKDETKNEVEYAVYSQKLPKEYVVYSGTQTVVANVVSIDTTDENNPVILEVTTSQTAQLVVQESAYLSKEEIITPDVAETLNAKISALQEGKQDKLTAGDNISIDENNVISATGELAAKWGNITGEINEQEDLKNALDEKANTSGNYPDLTVGNASNATNAATATKAIQDGAGSNIEQQFADINGKIPSAASNTNQLADKAFVNSTVNSMAAFYIEYNAQGNAFPTRAALINATTFYNAGQLRVPTQNDYAYVLSDESQPKDSLGNYPTTRYSYQGGTYPDGQWGFQYIVNNTSLTQAQVNALNSGITQSLVQEFKNKAEKTGNYPQMTVGNATSAKNDGDGNNIKETYADLSGATFTGNISAPQLTGSNGVFDGGERVYSTNNPPPIFYGVCSTDSGTITKLVSIINFVLVVGARITVNFSNSNTITAPTLNVNNTGAKAMKCNGRTQGLKWKAGEIMELVYNGTNWCILSGYALADIPVGFIYYSNDSTSPATLFGGAWTAIQGRVIVGYGISNNPCYKGTYSSTTQYNVNDIVRYNGSYYLCKAQTTGNTPSSSNTWWVSYQAGSTGGEATHTLTISEMPAHNHALYQDMAPSEKTDQVVKGAYYDIAPNYNNGSLMATCIQNTGGSQSHNNMPPYLAKYIWERIE